MKTNTFFASLLKIGDQNFVRISDELFAKALPFSDLAPPFSRGLDYGRWSCKEKKPCYLADFVFDLFVEQGGERFSFLVEKNAQNMLCTKFLRGDAFRKGKKSIVDVFDTLLCDRKDIFLGF